MIYCGFKGVKQQAWPKTLLEVVETLGALQQDTDVSPPLIGTV